MKLITFGVFIFALSFCGIADKIKEMASKSGSNTAANSSSNTASNTAKSNSTTSTNSSSSDTKAEKASLTSEQQAALEGGQETKWDDQGVTWTLPKGWKKMDQNKMSFNYRSPDNAFLLVNVSNMNSDFPVDQSIKAYYDSAVQKIKTGEYENVRYLEIDGVKGIEFVETMPQDKEGARRHQWIAYRNYMGQTEQLNVMLSTKGSNFEKHRTDFPAILYSMKIQQ